MTVGIRDVAAHAGVSVGTVSAALNGGEIAKATSAMVWRSIDELGYVPNGAARQLRVGKSKTVGLIVPDLQNPFYSAISQGAEDRAAEDQLVVLVGVSRSESARESEYIRYFTQQRAAGLVLTGAQTAWDHSKELHVNVPKVLVGHAIAGQDAVASVLADDVEGGRLAASHLLERGRRKIAFVGGSPWPQQVEDRLKGARTAVTGVAGASVTAFRAHSMTLSGGVEIGTKILMGRRPDAIFAANDLLALGILEACRATANVRVPDEIAVVGYDDIEFASSGVVPLTSIRQPAREMGAAAMHLLLNPKDDTQSSRHQKFNPQLVVRSSS